MLPSESRYSSSSPTLLLWFFSFGLELKQLTVTSTENAVSNATKTNHNVTDAASSGESAQATSPRRTKALLPHPGLRYVPFFPKPAITLLTSLHSVLKSPTSCFKQLKSSSLSASSAPRRHGIYCLSSNLRHGIALPYKPATSIPSSDTQLLPSAVSAKIPGML